MRTALSKFRRKIVADAERKSSHLAIKAVAGAGKTTLLVAILERLQTGVSQVLAVNGTKKAKREIRSKLADEAVSLNRLDLRTFHSISYQFLGDFGGATIPKLTGQHFTKGKYQIPQKLGLSLDDADCIKFLHTISDRSALHIKE